MKNIKCLHASIIVDLFVKIYFIFFARRGSQTNKKFFPQRPPLLLPFRHLILHFGRKNNTYVTKNKNKIKVIPHQYKMTLKH